ncbi:MAG: hypothetical protein ABIJ41_03975 [Candidatus Omnitrophota bacterium]
MDEQKNDHQEQKKTPEKDHETSVESILKNMKDKDRGSKNSQESQPDKGKPRDLADLAGLSQPEKEKTNKPETETQNTDADGKDLERTELNQLKTILNKADAEAQKKESQDAQEEAQKPLEDEPEQAETAAEEVLQTFAQEEVATQEKIVESKEQNLEEIELEDRKAGSTKDKFDSQESEAVKRLENLIQKYRKEKKKGLS